MGSIITGSICCCCGVCFNQCQQGMKKLIGIQRMTRLFYLFLIAIFVIPSIFIFFFLYNWSQFNTFFSKWISCSNTKNFQCIGSSVIFRLSLSLVCLFLFLTIMMCFRNKCSQVINQGFFCWKYLIILSTFVGFLFLPNQIFEDYSIATKYISIVFMTLQTIILIDLFYLFGIQWVKKYDQGKIKYGVYLVIGTFVAEAIAVALNVYGYIKFAEDICGSTLWVNIVTSIVLLFLPVFQFLHFNKQNSLLTTSLISIYISYLSLIAQYSFPGECSKLSTGSLAVDIGVSTFFFILTMYGSVMGGSGQVKLTKQGDVNRAIGLAPNTSRLQVYQDEGPNPVTDQQLKQQEKKQREQEMKKQKQFNKQNPDKINQQIYTNTWSWVKWHLYITLACIYVAVLITNWNSANILNPNITPNGFSFWVRIAISWATTIIYLWTLVAPRIFAGRNFNTE